MTRKLTVLGMAIAAVLAMSAVTASAASAAEFFHSEVEPTTIKGEQTGEDVFTTTAGTVKCKKATYSGTQATKTAEFVEIEPAYSECTAFTFVNTTIDTNGCKYKFTLATPTTPVDINCPTGKKIVVTAFNCWVEVGPQEKIPGTVTYTNTGKESARDIDVSVSLEKITYTQVSKSFPGCSNTTDSNGTYTGNATVRGFNSGGTQVGIWKE